MALPCPSCSNPLGMDINFIIKNPISVCPYCGVIMNFSADKKVVNDYKRALSEVESIKQRYKDVAKFTSK